jgi:hypothetical protein
MSVPSEQDRLIESRDASWITRREALQRVTALLGGIALVGGPALLTACRDRTAADAAGPEIHLFTAQDIAFLDEVADTILPDTHTPGAKAAGVGSFMALAAQDVYSLENQQVFIDGMRQLEAECQRMHGVGFMQATPAQRLALLEHLDREQMEHMQRRDEARRQARAGAADPRDADPAEADAYLPDQRQEGAITGDASATPAITADAPAHYFRMMKETALLGYFTSEIGYTQAMRWVETPGIWEPCVPYTPGETIWAPHP